MKLLATTSAAVAVIVLALAVWLLIDMDGSFEAQPVAAASASVEVSSAEVATEELEPDVPAPPAGPQDMAALLQEYAEQTNTETAFAQLFELWGGRFEPGTGRPCDQALEQGLECVYQQGSWGQLRTLNRPAILTLFDDSGNAHQVVVAGLDSAAAKIDLPERHIDVSIASISRLWYGDYLVLWRPQVSAPRALSAGMQGDGVRWLRHTLNSVHGRPLEEAPSDYYDEELVRMVEDFQRRHRLRVDGIAGVQTQIVLDALANSTGAPQLIAQTSPEQEASG
jgi:general secretion pathway protein A